MLTTHKTDFAAPRTAQEAREAEARRTEILKSIADARVFTITPGAHSGPLSKSSPDRREALRAELASARTAGESDRAYHLARELEIEEHRVALSHPRRLMV